MFNQLCRQGEQVHLNFSIFLRLICIVAGVDNPRATKKIARLAVT